MKDCEERLRYFLKTRWQAEKTINAMMEMELVAYKETDRAVTLSFPITSWQLNPAATLHGGLISTMADMTMACCAYMYSDAHFTPTSQISLSFHKPAYVHTTLLVEAKCEHIGKRLVNVYCMIRCKESNEKIATALGSYVINK